MNNHKITANNIIPNRSNRLKMRIQIETNVKIAESIRKKSDCIRSMQR